MANVKVTEATKEPTVRVNLPLLEDESAQGGVDQTVPVTINGETLIIKRGETVDLPVPYFMVLKESGRFHNL